MKNILTILMLLFYLVGCSGNQPNNTNVNSGKPKTEEKKDTSNHTEHHDKKVKLSSKVVLTKHAKCRMDCRKIDLEEIKEIIEKGKINPRKSDTKAKPCPKLAFEGISTRDRQQIRVVLAACKDETKIITVIDTGVKVDPNCNCK